jgi:hypothetical protein
LVIWHFKQSRGKITTKKPVLMKHNLRALVAYSIESKLGFGARCEVGWVGSKLC